VGAELADTGVECIIFVTGICSENKWKKKKGYLKIAWKEVTEAICFVVPTVT
jgi:hypothetical protein